MTPMHSAPAMVSGRDAFGQALLDLADAVPEMVVLDADVASSTKTTKGPPRPGEGGHIGRMLDSFCRPLWNHPSRVESQQGEPHDHSG